MATKAEATPLALPPLSLYIHVPWCLKKCPYCDFNSHQQQGELPETAYLDCLLRDLDADLPLAQNRPLQSIFIGGGTPSLFSAQAYQRLLQAIATRLPLVSDLEVTLEANPGTFEQNKFQGYREAGINRLSIGIQSFDPAMLQRLGRVHDGQEALKAAHIARQAGFDNFNLDLMFGLPTQDQQGALNDLQQALDCQPTHLSWYQLTLEPNTAFYRFPPSLPVDDQVAAMQEAGQALLAEAGFRQYEISAYARARREARHNLNYWQFGDYLGIGAGAHGKLTQAGGRILRTRKTRQPADYLARQQDFLAQQRLVEDAELPLEFMMNALRLSEGVPLQLFTQRTGLTLDCISPQLHKLQRQGLLTAAGLDDPAARLRPTATGLRHLNTLLEAFL